MNVECPTCKKSVDWTDANPWRPFCSERCKLFNLQNWVDERYRVPGDRGLSLPRDDDLIDGKS